ncbi:MAG: hypothetical protein O6938_09400 [Gammaproteobacteria bacterium]|nr:hypothetical protein [Gammaproteobacteria bacterium]MCZ6797584.1 hypothetical protein [Gammaproteobacteria bacterium]
MDNLITGLIAITVFLAFTIGLAVSIGTLPFFLIVIIVAGLVLIAFYQSVKAGLKNNNSKAS